MMGSASPASSATSCCARCAASPAIRSRYSDGRWHLARPLPFPLWQHAFTADSAVHPFYLRHRRGRVFPYALCGNAWRCVMKAIDLENRYSAHNYAPLPVVLARGKGAHLWDTAGRRYVDMMSAYSAASHGHGHPRILAALSAQAERLAVPSRAYYNDRLGPFLEELCRVTGLDAAIPMNTGAEAVETAIKA